MNGIKDWKKDDAFASGKHVICGESTGIQVRDKYLLSLVEASDYFNIGINRLRRIAENHGVLFPIFQQEAFSFQCMMEKKMFICHPDICRFSDCWSIIVIPCIIKNNIVQ